MRWLAPNPDKRWMEKFVLVYSPIWIAIIGVVEFGAYFRHWGDLAHLTLGVGLAAPLWLVPLALGKRGHAMRWNGLILLFAFLQCYFGSKLFFETFGMQYHFPVTWVVNGTPLFLYFLTIAYFSTYYVAQVILLRAFRSRFPHAPRVASWIVRALLGYAVAFAETATMATPRLQEWFSYANPRWVMIFGSLCYGTIFFVSLPLFADLDEDDRPARPFRALAWDTLALNLLILILYEVYAAVIRLL